MSDKAHLWQRLSAACTLIGTFKLRSGAVSKVYFDKYQFESNPQMLSETCWFMNKMVPAGVEALAGLEMGGIPLVTTLAALLDLPCAFIRKQPKAYGTARYAEGVSLHNKRFVLVEDVVTSGGAVLNALAMMKADGLAPQKVICVLDRGEGGRQAIEGAGVPFEALFTLGDGFSLSKPHDGDRPL